MGTSTSSSGPSGNIPYDPPWLDRDDMSDGTNQDSTDEQPQNDESQPDSNTDALPSNDLAQPKRLYGAKRNFRNFMKSGSEKALGRALGGYSGKGMGGTSRFAHRMQRSTTFGAGIYSLFQDIRSGTSSDPKTKEFIRYLSSGSHSTEEIKNAVIRHFLPEGGSLDEEASRNSLYQAMSDLAKKPNIDLTKPTEADIWILIENFMVYEVIHRVAIDLGQATESKSFTPTEVVKRRKEMKAYVRSVMSVEFRKIKSENRSSILTSSEMKKLLNSILKETFGVFEGNL